MSTQTRIYKVADAAKPPADYADRDFITQNTGGAVIVGYSVKRLGANPAVPSETAEFHIVPAFFDITDFTDYGLNGWKLVTSNGGVVELADGNFLYMNKTPRATGNDEILFEKTFSTLIPDTKHFFSVRARNRFEPEHGVFPTISLLVNGTVVSGPHKLTNEEFEMFSGEFVATKLDKLAIRSDESRGDDGNDYELDDTIVSRPS